MVGHSAVDLPLIFEPTCAHARWAFMHRFLSVCLYGRKILISGREKTYYIGHGEKRIVKKGRWAHNNVKLFHIFHIFFDNLTISHLDDITPPFS